MTDRRDERTYAIIGAAMEVHGQLGMGFTEFVYQDALAVEFKIRNIPYEREKRIAVLYKGVQLEHIYYADFVCYDDIVIETKAATSIVAEHRRQLLNYMHATNSHLGLLINFGEGSLRYERYVL